jgi:pyruvate dehydrogenase E1 component
MVPNCRSYDPCFAGEFAVILDHGMRAMLERQEDVFYYVTLMNESYAQPSLPAGVEADIVKGLYRFATHTPAAEANGRVRLVGSGTILREVIAAAARLAADWRVEAEVWSATSFAELDRDAREVERWNRLHPEQAPRSSHVVQCLAGDDPVIAATDYVRAWPQLAGAHIEAPFTALGTDGFGRSDTRASLRRFFEIDCGHVVLAALTALRTQGRVDAATCARAIAAYGLAEEAPAPWTV